MTMDRRDLLDSERRRHSPDADTPAVAHGDGYEAYYSHGELHRASGPAVIRPNRAAEFWVRGHHMTQEQFERLVEQGVDLEDPEAVLKATMGTMYLGTKK